mgnify:CR=1 FL=1
MTICWLTVKNFFRSIRKEILFFEIPIAEFDEPMAVTADTTAMSVPHEVEYTLTFASDTVTASGSGSGMSGSVNIALWIAVAVAVFMPVVTRMRRKEKK